MRHRIIAACIVLFIVAAFACTLNARPQNYAHWEFALSWTARFIGVILALSAGVTLLLQCWTTPGFVSVPPALLVFLAGTLLFTQQWSVGLALGAIGIALTGRLWKKGKEASSAVAGDARAEAE